MKKKARHITQAATLLALLLAAAACNDDDHRNPTAIVNSYLDEYSQLLTASPRGWRFDYYPNETTYGAFNFLMKFGTDGRVEMQTDENFYALYEKADELAPYDPATPQSSTYTLQNSQGPVLTFATYSLLSKLADPSFYEHYGSGWNGDNEFVLMGHSAAGDTIYLKSVRAQKHCYLVKNEEEWSDYLNALNRVMADFMSNAENKYFMDIELPGSQQPAVLAGTSLDTRVGTLYHYRDGEFAADSCRLLFGPQGVSLQSPVTVNGTAISHFSYRNGTFLVNEIEGSSIAVAHEGRPKLKFPVKDKLFVGSYTNESEGLTVNDVYYLYDITNEEHLQLFWNLADHMESYSGILLIPSAPMNYVFRLIDYRKDENEQSTMVMYQCPFSMSWNSTDEDEDVIAFRGYNSQQGFYRSYNLKNGSWEAGTQLVRDFEADVQSHLDPLLYALFGSSRNRVRCVAVPTPDFSQFRLVNIKDGTYVMIEKS